MGRRERNRSRVVERTVRVSVFVLALVPFVRLLAQALTDGLGANPIEELTHRTGWWTLAFLMLTLAVTPLRQLSGIGWLVKLRRMLGLYAFFYASLHFAIYLGIDQFFAWEYIIEDIVDRPYITVGFTALLTLIPLAVTSTKKMIRRLGGSRWNSLHRLVYVAAALGVLHYLWLVKADIRSPAIFGGVLVTLLAYRVVAKRLRRGAPQRRRGASSTLEAGRSPVESRAGAPQAG